MSAPNLMSRTLGRLVMMHPWFASLALRLHVIEEPGLGTACTDGRFLKYDPEWFADLGRAVQATVVAHEVMHCAFLHMTRRGYRDAKLWNVAGDHVINLELEAAGFEFPPGCLKDPRFKGKSTEAVYAIVEAEASKNPDQGPGEDPLGGVEDAGPGEEPSPGEEAGDPGDGSQDGSGASEGGTGEEQASGADRAALESDWKVAVEQASMVASKAGQLPESMKRKIDEATARTDWRDTLARYLTVPGDYSWTTPNRRHIAHGLYLPGSRIERLRRVVFAVDTSGSIDSRLLNTFAAEANNIMGSAGRPSRVTIMYCDAVVQGETELDEWSPIEFEAKGGGGTAFQPVFDRVQESGELPDVLFYLTDLECYSMPQDPGYPVVWIAPVQYKREMPFGEVALIDVNETRR